MAHDCQPQVIDCQPYRARASAATFAVSRKFLNELEHGKPSLRADKVIAVLAALSLAPVVVPRFVLEGLR